MPIESTADHLWATVIGRVGWGASVRAAQLGDAEIAEYVRRIQSGEATIDEVVAEIEADV